MTVDDERLYAIALTRISNFNFAAASTLYHRAGSAKAIYDCRNDIRQIATDCSPRLAESIRHWDEPLRRAETEMEFCYKHSVEPLVVSDERYPRRLAECGDAPLVLYYKGNANLNQKKIVSIIGTRRCTAYGADLIRHFAEGLRRWCKDVLVVSGLAYGVDINAHRQALSNGYETVGVLAHGLDRLYPPRHRDTAKEMLSRGGLLTEFMTMTVPDRPNFVRRNRIVAGVSDATILVESAAKGGGLITTSIARSYDREVFAFPGAVGAEYSVGCNNAIRDNMAQLITCADDFVKAMGWDDENALQEAQSKGIERQLFPDLTDDERRIVELLKKSNDLQVNIIGVKTNIPISQLIGLLFQLEMKGVVTPYAGGTYHLLA